MVKVLAVAKALKELRSYRVLLSSSLDVPKIPFGVRNSSLLFSFSCEEVVSLFKLPFKAYFFGVVERGFV